MTKSTTSIMYPVPTSEQIEALAKMMTDPMFWVIVFIVCLINAVVKATIKHFSKPK